MCRDPEPPTTNKQPADLPQCVESQGSLVRYVELIGWTSPATLLVTITRQVYTQWKTESTAAILERVKDPSEMAFLRHASHTRRAFRIKLPILTPS
jgi:hypothetical protein